MENKPDTNRTRQQAGTQKRTQKAIGESEEWLFTTLQSIGDAVTATDAAGSMKSSQANYGIDIQTGYFFLLTGALDFLPGAVAASSLRGSCGADAPGDGDTGFFVPLSLFF